MNLDKSFSFSTFLGIFDPDGRPWDNIQGGLTTYEKGIEAVLKVSFLTRKHIIIPIGYFFDNVGLQKVVLKYSGDDENSVAFRELFEDLVIIALKHSDYERCDEASKVDWDEAWRYWCSGDSRLGSMVYFNSLKDEVSKELQKFNNLDKFIKSYQNATLDCNNIYFRRYLEVLKQLNFKFIGQERFKFNEFIKNKFLSEEEKFASLAGNNKKLLEKVQYIYEASNSSNLGLSRSLLQNENKLLEIGVKDEFIISRQDYNILAPITAHYHHYSFADSLNLKSCLTYILPEPDIETSKEWIYDNLNEILQPNQSYDYSQLFIPAKDINFKVIKNIRLSGKNSTIFKSNISHIMKAIKNKDKKEYRLALKNHRDFVCNSIRKDLTVFKKINLDMNDMNTLINAGIITTISLFKFGMESTAITGLIMGAIPLAFNCKANMDNYSQVKNYFRFIDIDDE